MTYTPPINTAVDFDLSSGYSPPVYDSIVFTDGAASRTLVRGYIVNSYSLTERVTPSYVEFVFSIKLLASHTYPYDDVGVVSAVHNFRYRSSFVVLKPILLSYSNSPRLLKSTDIIYQSNQVTTNKLVGLYSSNPRVVNSGVFYYGDTKTIRSKLFQEYISNKTLVRSSSILYSIGGTVLNNIIFPYPVTSKVSSSVLEQPYGIKTVNEVMSILRQQYVVYSDSRFLTKLTSLKINGK